MFEIFGILLMVAFGGLYLSIFIIHFLPEYKGKDTAKPFVYHQRGKYYSRNDKYDQVMYHTFAHPKGKTERKYNRRTWLIAWILGMMIFGIVAYVSANNKVCEYTADVMTCY